MPPDRREGFVFYVIISMRDVAARVRVIPGESESILSRYVDYSVAERVSRAGLLCWSRGGLGHGISGQWI